MLRSNTFSWGLRVLFLVTLVLVQTIRADPGHHHGHHKSDREHKTEDYHEINDRLDRITSRLEDIEHGLDKRLSPKVRQKALSLEKHLSKFEEKHCEDDHYDCGGQEHECVSRLFVCDGHSDCRNGADEKHCTLPTTTGSEFVGYLVYNHCDHEDIDKFIIRIEEVQVRPAFPGFPILRAVSRAVQHSKTEHNEFAFPLLGYYRFSNNKLVLFPPRTEETNDNGIICEFDGFNPDRCEAYIVNKVSLHRCAKYIMYRRKNKHHDDDHDDDHHDDDHHHNDDH